MNENAITQEAVWELAKKVRTELDRASCPDAFMRIAVEAVMEHAAAPVAAAPVDLTNWAAHYSINPTAVEALQSMLTSTDAAQDAVPYGYVFTDDPAKFAMPGSGFHFGPVPPTDAINVVPLYAAPVAAAPVDLDAHGLRALDNCIRDLRRLLELADDFALDDMQIQSFLTAIESMELRKVASTPAAPGIGLEQFREAVLAQHAALMDSWCGDPETKEAADKQRDRLLSLIDASPKGVTLHNDGSSEAQFIADTERLNCPACGGSGHVDDSPKGGSTDSQDAARYRHHRDSGGLTFVEKNEYTAYRVIKTGVAADAATDAAMQATSAEVGE